MQDKVGAHHLLERGPEGRHQRVRQIGDEPDGIGQDHAPPAWQLQLAHGRVERLEHLVLGGDGGAGQPVEQRGLAGVGVADDGHHREGHPAAPRTVQAARLDHHGQLLADGRDALVDQPPVGLDLRLAGAAEEAEAAALALQVGPGADQPALLVGEVRQLHLQAALARGRTLAEDLQDQAGAVEHLAAPGLLQVALLHRAQGMIDDGQRGLAVGDQRPKLGHLAGAEQRRRPRLRQRHDLFRNDIELYGARQPRAFCEAVPRRVHDTRTPAAAAIAGRRAAGRACGHEHDGAQPHRPAIQQRAAAAFRLGRGCVVGRNGYPC